MQLLTMIHLMRTKLAVFTALLVLPSYLFSQKDSSPSGPVPMSQDVIKIIDQHYLRAQANPLWNIAKEKILAGDYHNPAEACRNIQTQLAILEDSELNLLNSDEMAATQSEALGEKTGIGLPDFAIDRNIDSGEARIITPIVGSPAMQAGIEPRDVISSINGKGTNDMTHEQVMEALRAGPVRLAIHCGDRQIEVTLQPAAEKLRAVEFFVRPTRTGKIGYIRVAQFTPDAAAAVKNAINSLEQSGVSAYVLDLRNNPGGYLNAARETAGFFASGTLGYERNPDNTRKPVDAAGKPLTGKPLAILINGGTASAAEFVAAGLQGLQRALLVGTKTYGRGRAQIFFSIGDDYGLQVPAVELLTAAGKSFKDTGIAPGIEVERGLMQEKDRGGLRDRQLLRAEVELERQKPQH